MQVSGCWREVQTEDGMQLIQSCISHLDQCEYATQMALQPVLFDYNPESRTVNTAL